MRIARLFALAIVIQLINAAPRPALGQAARMLPQAHAHNDYLHARPLLDALEQGFGSVEADIFLVGDELLVAHERSALAADRTLRKLYLEPLKQRIAEHSGSVFGDGENFTLLIDIKTAGEPTYQVLNKLLAEYGEMFSHFDQGQWQPGAVTAIVSGNRPIELITQSSPRFAGIDGRLSDLDSKRPVHLMPLISDNWNMHFSWRGQGEFPAAEREKLEEIVSKSHAEGRRIRLWATVDTPAMWNALREADVDLINTDNLAGLREFLTK
ncbi:MAG: phosphatidylinositol-specific phospholipase C/glycerophosphodiester phosphodiesterase family protein [Pirellulaceae bacterium]|nr:phosphatidylinositol-specific phospholipase C/glycerophosphodiester phosphodiesterase family protein [Pirellulaceae bacterium]